MTLYATNSRIRHDTDAMFREWGQEFHDALDAVGLTQSADTGQINWTTVTRATSNADAGYEIRYMNDSLHGTKPIYIKFYFGTGGAADRPRVRIEVGTGTNGAGTITGGHTVYLCTSSAGTTFSTDVNYASYWAFTPGCFWWAHKVNRPSSELSMSGGVIARTVDNTGAISGSGFACIYHNASSGSSSAPSAATYDYVNSTWRSTTTVQTGVRLAMTPFPSTTSVSASVNAFAAIPFFACDIPRPFPQVLIGSILDTNFGQSFTLTPIGAAARKYIALDNVLGTPGIAYNGSTNGTLMLQYDVT